VAYCEDGEVLKFLNLSMNAAYVNMGPESTWNKDLCTWVRSSGSTRYSVNLLRSVAILFNHFSPLIRVPNAPIDLLRSGFKLPLFFWSTMPTSTKNEKVLIIGSGPGALALAQILQKHHIEYEVFERDESQRGRKQGWAVALIE
jgi:hypothetical protein